MRGRVEAEPNHLLAREIIEPVKHAEEAAPLVKPFEKSVRKLHTDSKSDLHT